ncbi:MAG: hypothetical protein GYB68_10890 [Chloroflexi bacterium]|nr:hypothetical protein [Chloroflexota bacterium]
MAIQIERLDNEPIVIVRVTDPVDNIEDPRQTNDGVLAALEQSAGTLWRITDFSEASLSFSDLVLGMGLDETMTHPQVRNIVVGASEMVEMIGSSAAQKQYGGLSVAVVEDLETALALARYDAAVSEQADPPA